MLVHVVEARYRGDHRVWLKFNDGLEGEVDLSAELSGDHKKAKTYYEKLVALGNQSDGSRRELQQARSYLAKR